jgi:hypothetical protein
VLWGWAPVEVHTPEYDESGRVVRTVVEREPDFDEEQHALVVALAAYEASLNEHGFPIEEVTSIDADPGNRNGKWRYKATSYIDWSAVAVDEHLKSKGDKDEYARARKIRVERIER